MGKLPTRYISSELWKEIKSLKEIIEKTFGINLRYSQVSKLVALKAKHSDFKLTKQKIALILLGRDDDF